MQPTESEGQLFVLVVDAPYYSFDEDSYPRESEAFRLMLEAEFGLPASEANIGPGADVPAFLIDIVNGSVPGWLLLLNVFFAGEPIKKNLAVWLEAARQLRKFLSRPGALGRHGASILALEAVFQEMGGIPKTVKLLSYRSEHDDRVDLADFSRSSEIGPNPPTLTLSRVKHLFEIEADGVLFRVSVEGTRTDIIRIA